VRFEIASICNVGDVPAVDSSCNPRAVQRQRCKYQTAKNRLGNCGVEQAVNVDGAVVLS
jgi:hypothetical protein